MAYKKYTKAKAVTAHDTDELTGFVGTAWDALYVGVTGNVNMILEKDSSAVLFKNMVQGTVYNVSPKIVLSTSTTATDIVSLDTGHQYS